MEQTKKSVESVADRKTLLKLQINENSRKLLDYKRKGERDDDVDDLLALNELADSSLENRSWPLHYIEELLATVERRMDGLGSRQDRYSNYPCLEIRDYTRRRAESSLPPPE